MPKSHPPYAVDFRQRLVELVRKGRTPEGLARQFEPSVQAIRNSVRPRSTPASVSGSALDFLSPVAHERVHANGDRAVTSGIDDRPGTRSLGVPRGPGAVTV